MDEYDEMGEVDRQTVFQCDTRDVGNAYERYVAENNASLLEMDHPKYGKAPLNTDGSVNPWPSNGLYLPAAISFVTTKFRNGKGYMGHDKLAASTLKSYEGRLRSAAYHRCQWDDDDVQRVWGKQFGGNKRNVQRATPAVAMLIRRHGEEIQGPRSTRAFMYAYDVDYTLEELHDVSDNVNRAMEASAMLSLHALTAKRNHTCFDDTVTCFDGTSYVF